MLLLNLKTSKNIKLDFFHLEEKDTTNENIFINPKYKPVLNNFSRFLVTFDDGTTIASGIADIALGYTFSVYREVVGSNELKFVSKLDDGALSIVDYNVVNDTDYKYYIFKESTDAISEAVVSNDVKTCWWEWSLVDLQQDLNNDKIYYANSQNIWLFGLNLTTSSVSQNISVTTYNNLTTYPRVSVGKQNYKSSSISTLLGSIKKVGASQISYIEPASLLEEWNDFCVNGNIKLMRDRKGNSMLVAITNTTSQVGDVLKEQANTVSFDWVEIGSTKNISIIGGNANV